ncbi:MAG: hypothetical protein LBI03_04170 [Clostridiales bacterium]|jgi:hypothetical protein|nr:hypothetical protein [Clostridiales bacterium]
MKGKLVLTFVVLAGFVFLSTPCYAQSISVEQQIVGTWVELGESQGETMVFNSNGTGSASGNSFVYGVAGNKLALVVGQGRQVTTTVMEFYISSDGKTLILVSLGSRNAPSGGNGSLLRKRN